MRKSKLLHVVSIIVIVFGALAVLSGLFAFAMQDVMTASYEMLGMTPPATPYYVFALIAACVELAAGIIGVMYKSKQSVLIIGAIWCVMIVAELVYSTVTSGFSALSILSLILPILYMWGWYQSE